MKNIEFQKCYAENFCLYIQPMEYIFENQKIKLITGPNGIGKSTIFDIIPFTFYGVTTKGLKGDEVVNNVIGKDCHTFVDFVITENNGEINNYRVDRYHKHKKFGNTVLLFKNDFTKPIKKGHNEVVPEIEKITVPQKLFLNTLLFGQKVKNFFTDLTDSDQKEIFRKVLQLDNYVLYHDETSKRIKSNNIEFQELDKKISLNRSRLVDVTSNISITQENIKTFEKKKKEEILILRKDLEDLNLLILELIEKEKLYENINDVELNKATEESSKAQNELYNISKEFDSLLKSLNDLKMVKATEFKTKSNELISKEKLDKTELTLKLNNEFQEYRNEMQKVVNDLLNNRESIKGKISGNEESIEKNKKEIIKLKTSLNKVEASCPTCGKPLTDESVKTHLFNELHSFENSNENMFGDNENYLELIEKINQDGLKTQALINKSKEALDLKISEIENSFKTKVQEIGQRESDALKKLEMVFEEKKKNILSEFEDKKFKLSESLNILIVEKNKLLNLFEEKRLVEKKRVETYSNIKLKEMLIKNKESEECNSFLENYFTEQDRLEEERKCLDEDKLSIEDDLQILEFWKTGFSSSGIPSLLIDDSIPFLNNTVSKYLEMIGGRYVVSFDTLSATKAGEYRDKINVNVLDTITKANHRKQFSGGQTRVVDIAILLSLCDLQNNVQNMRSNILLLDEIFDSLDDQNVAYISTVLRTLIKDKSINIISHRHIDTIEADEIIRFF